MMRTTHILRYNKTIAVLGAVLSSSVSVMLSLFIEVMLVFMAFVFLCFGIYITNSFQYRSIFSTMLALSEAFLGKFNINNIIAANGVFGGVVMLAYLLVMMCLMMNLLVSALNYILVKINETPDVIPKDHEIIEYFIDLLTSIFHRKSKKKSTELDGK